MESPDPALSDRAAAFDATWLATRRWFRSKSRSIVGVQLDDVARLEMGAGLLLVMRVRYQDGGEERYLVPAAEGEDGELREPRDGDGTWRGIAAAIAAGETLRGSAGTFEFHATAALAGLLPGGAGDAANLDEHRLKVEQSNTSVRLGDRLMLKVYRLLEDGVNPEVEVNAFLSDAGFSHAPAMAGWLTYLRPAAEPASAGMLQGLVASRGDAWSWMLEHLAGQPNGPEEALEGVALIGRITAQMHATLAGRPDEPGFPATVADAARLHAWRLGAEAQLNGALQSVPAAQRRRLEAVAGPIRYSFMAIESAVPPPVTRIHGDYHLGQLLRTESGFVVIDFEGEPARPLAERRAPSSPLRDVAGMLRSLDYAARTAERDSGGVFTPDGWLTDARSAFLSAYGPAAAEHAMLLRAFEAEKACYEVRYEANNRPDWTWLPVAALERLAA